MEELKQCQFCGENIPRNALKCKHCGEHVEVVVGTNSTTKNCPFCNELISETALICEYCNSALTDASINRTAFESVYQNNSGYGNSTIVPAEIKQWNWGAFWTTWIWGFANNSYYTLLAFIPYFGFLWMIACGLKGNEWAWKNRRWANIKEFQSYQYKWAKASNIIIGILLSLIVLFFVTTSTNGSNSKAPSMYEKQQTYEKDYKKYVTTEIKNNFFTENYLKGNVVRGFVDINNDGSVAKVELYAEPVDRTYLEKIAEMKTKYARMIQDTENEIFNMKFKPLDRTLTNYIDNDKPFSIPLLITSKNYYRDDYQRRLTDKALELLYLPKGVQTLSCSVWSKVDRSGKILSIGIKNSSGNSEFDNDAVTAVKRAAPLLGIGLPSEYEGETADLLIKLWKKKNTHKVDSTEWKYISE